MFMLLDVPEPVWKTSIGNSSSWAPAATSSAAATIASAMSWSRTPSSALALRAGGLDLRQRADVRRLERRAGDREVLDRALRLRAPQGVAGHLYLAHGVVLDAEVGARRS